MPKTTKQLVDEANQAYAAWEDVHAAYDRSIAEGKLVTQRMGNLISGKAGGTLSELQALFAQTENRGSGKLNLSSKTAKARLEACSAYAAACEALAKDAGLTDGMEPRANIRQKSIPEDKMVGQQEQDGSESPGVSPYRSMKPQREPIGVAATHRSVDDWQTLRQHLSLLRTLGQIVGWCLLVLVTSKLR